MHKATQLHVEVFVAPPECGADRTPVRKVARLLAIAVAVLVVHQIPKDTQSEPFSSGARHAQPAQQSILHEVADIADVLVLHYSLAPFWVLLTAPFGLYALHFPVHGLISPWFRPVPTVL
jgi:hypothetical protein